MNQSKKIVDFNNPTLLQHLKPIVHNLPNQENDFPVKDSSVMIGGLGLVSLLQDGRLSTDQPRYRQHLVKQLFLFPGRAYSSEDDINHVP